MPFQAVARALYALRDDPRYQALTNPPADDHCDLFRRDVEGATFACLFGDPTPDAIRFRLAGIRDRCRGNLTPLRTAIERALGELDGAASQAVG